jgi:hypothetical protein
VRDAEELERIRTYLRMNPEEAGLTEEEFGLAVEGVLRRADDSPGETPAGPTGKMPVLRP